MESLTRMHVPYFNSSQMGCYSIYLPQLGGRLSCPWCWLYSFLRLYTCPQTVTHPSIIQALRSATLLIKTNLLTTAPCQVQLLVIWLKLRYHPFVTLKQNIMLPMILVIFMRDSSYCCSTF